ncbi:MAG: hypothetical protein ABSD59_00955 [Terracidiphilus sp.]
MRIKMFFLFAALISLLCPACPAQTDIAASLYGAFNQSTSANGTKQSPANSAGGLIELRQIRSPLFGYEATYAYNRANQGLSNGSFACPGVSCTVSTAAISANAHEVTGDWVISLKTGSLRPFALAGGGLLLNVPTGGTVTTATCSPFSCVASSTTAAATSTSTKGVFVYGAGVDWTVLPHLGLRLQYRGSLYQASSLATAFSSTNAFTQTAEPVIGVFFRL